MGATGKVALDTSVIVAALRRQPGILEHLRGAGELWVPLFALGELEYGANRGIRPDRQKEAIRIFMLSAGVLLRTAAPPWNTDASRRRWPRPGRPCLKTTSGLQPWRPKTKSRWLPWMIISAGYPACPGWIGRHHQNNEPECFGHRRFAGLGLAIATELIAALAKLGLGARSAPAKG